MSSTVVRVFNVGDSVKVADFLSKVFLEEGRPRPADEVSSLVKSWLEEQSKGMTPFIAFRDEIAVGLLLLDERSPSITYIQWLHVLKHYRRQKVGSNLMETALERVWARGIPLASLHTAPDNIAAQGLYTKYGFVSMQPPGGYMVNFGSHRKLQWNPDFDYSHLRQVQAKYQLGHGIGANAGLRRGERAASPFDVLFQVQIDRRDLQPGFTH